MNSPEAHATFGTQHWKTTNKTQIYSGILHKPTWSISHNSSYTRLFNQYLICAIDVVLECGNNDKLHSKT